MLFNAIVNLLFYFHFFLQLRMEFFDFAGADPEEKALALDALSRTETVKVSDVLDYFFDLIIFLIF